MNDLTNKDKETLNFIIQFQNRNGFSPSLNEIKNYIGTKSTRAVTLHLNKLNNLGYIKRDSNARRAIKILYQNPSAKEEEIKAPILGEVKAGYGGITEQNIEGHKLIPLSLTGGRRDVVLLKIRGESMNRAGFNHGDLAIIVPQSKAYDGDIVVAFDPDDETATLKRYKKLGGYVLLLPESDDPSYEPKVGSQFVIQGKVIGKI